MTDLPISEEELKQIIEQEEQESDGQQNRPAPELVAAMTAVATQVYHDNPEENLNEVILTTIDQLMRSLVGGSVGNNLATMIFMYYIEVYRAFHVVEKEKVDGEIADTRYYYIYYDKAALSIFELYQHNPTNNLTRRIVPEAALGIHESVAARHTRRSDVPLQELMGYVSTIALITQSLRYYVKGSKRKLNIPYIKWVEEFLRKCLTTTNFDFMDNDDTLKSIIVQLTQHKRVITL